MWLGEVRTLEALLTFLGTGELGSSQGAPLTSSARQMVAAGHCQPGSDVWEAGAGEPGSGPDVPAPAGWPMGLLSDMLWSSASRPPLSKKAPPPPLLFFLEHIRPGSCLGKDMHTSGPQRSLPCGLTFQPRD